MAGEIKITAPTNLGGTQAEYFQRYLSQVGMLDAASGVGGFDVNSSVFNNYSGLGGGFGGGFGGFSGGFGDTYGLYNDPEFLKLGAQDRMAYLANMQKQQARFSIATQNELNQLQLDNQVKQKHLMEVAEFKATAAEDKITRQCGILQSKIKEDEQVQVSEEYKKLTKAVREKFAEVGYTNIDETQVRAQAEKLYYEATGVRLIGDIEQHGSNDFVQGLKEGAGFSEVFSSLLSGKNSMSAKENIAYNITGEERTAKDNALRLAGRIIGGVATAAVAVASFFLLKKGGGALFGKLLKGRNQPVLSELEKLTKTITQKGSHLDEARAFLNSNPNNAGAKSIVEQLETEIAGLKAKVPGLQLAELEKGTGVTAKKLVDNQSSINNTPAVPPAKKIKGTSSPKQTPKNTTTTATATATATSIDENYTIKTIPDAIKARTEAKNGNKKAEEALDSWLASQSSAIKQRFA